MNVAFVVGCSGYEDAGIADLKYAHRDATSFAGLLKETCGLRDDEIMLIHDEYPEPRRLPTRANILRQISRGAEVTKSATIDMLFFFFSGHGFRSTATQSDYLLTRDTFTTAPEDSSLPFDMILRRLREWEPRHVLLFLDACRASTAGGKAVLSDELPNVDVASLCPSGMVSFCSCEPGRSSYESEDLQAGIFTAGSARPSVTRASATRSMSSTRTWPGSSRNCPGGTTGRSSAPTPGSSLLASNGSSSFRRGNGTSGVRPCPSAKSSGAPGSPLLEARPTQSGSCAPSTSAPATRWPRS